MSLNPNVKQEFSSFGVGSPEGATSIAITLPNDAYVDGNELTILVVMAACEPAGTPFTGHAPIGVTSPPAGLTLLTSTSFEYDATGGGTGVFVSVYYIQGVSGGPTITFNTGNDLSVWTVVGARISNAASPPINAFSAIAVGTDADPSTVTTASITTTVNDCLLLFFCLEAFTAGGVAAATPTGWSRFVYQTTGGGLSYFTEGISAVQGMPIAGATGAVSSQPIAAAPGLGFNPRPMAITIAVEPKVGVARAYFLSTNGVGSTV
jgi:hypothetical protein